jgi:hypothetical protein
MERQRQQANLTARNSALPTFGNLSQAAGSAFNAGGGALQMLAA